LLSGHDLHAKGPDDTKIETDCQMCVDIKRLGVDLNVTFRQFKYEQECRKSMDDVAHQRSLDDSIVVMNKMRELKERIEDLELWAEMEVRGRKMNEVSLLEAMDSIIPEALLHYCICRVRGGV